MGILHEEGSRNKLNIFIIHGKLFIVFSSTFTLLLFQDFDPFYLGIILLTFLYLIDKRLHIVFIDEEF